MMSMMSRVQQEETEVVWIKNEDGSTRPCILRLRKGDNPNFRPEAGMKCKQSSGPTTQLHVEPFLDEVLLPDLGTVEEDEHENADDMNDLDEDNPFVYLRPAETVSTISLKEDPTHDGETNDRTQNCSQAKRFKLEPNEELIDITVESFETEELEVHLSTIDLLFSLARGESEGCNLSESSETKEESMEDLARNDQLLSMCRNDFKGSILFELCHPIESSGKPMTTNIQHEKEGSIKGAAFHNPSEEATSLGTDDGFKPQGPVQCRFCHLTFQNRDLTQHLSRIHNWPGRACRYCNESFDSCYKFFKHTLKKHGIHLQCPSYRCSFLAFNRTKYFCEHLVKSHRIDISKIDNNATLPQSQHETLIGTLQWTGDKIIFSRIHCNNLKTPGQNLSNRQTNSHTKDTNTPVSTASAHHPTTIQCPKCLQRICPESFMEHMFESHQHIFTVKKGNRGKHSNVTACIGDSLVQYQTIPYKCNVCSLLLDSNTRPLWHLVKRHGFQYICPYKRLCFKTKDMQPECYNHLGALKTHMEKIHGFTSLTNIKTVQLKSANAPVNGHVVKQEVQENTTQKQTLINIVQKMKDGEPAPQATTGQDIYCPSCFKKIPSNPMLMRHTFEQHCNLFLCNSLMRHGSRVLTAVSMKDPSKRERKKCIECNVYLKNASKRLTHLMYEHDYRLICPYSDNFVTTDVHSFWHHLRRMHKYNLSVTFETL